MKKNINEGVVVQVTENQYVLLCDDGTFKNIPLTKTDIPMIGDRKTYKAKKRNLAFGTVSTVAMIAILFITFLGYFGPEDEMKTQFIAAIDINPSIEVQLDSELQVVKLLSLNTDGQKIIESIDVEGKGFYQAVDQIISQTISAGYLKEDKDGSIEVTIANVTNQSEPPSKNKLTTIIQHQLERKNIVATVGVFNETKEFYEQSEQANISMNKYRHYQILREQGKVKNIEDVKEKSINQLENLMKKDEKNPSVKLEENQNSQENKKSNKMSDQNKKQHSEGANGKKENKPNTKQNSSDSIGSHNKKKSLNNNGSPSKDKAHVKPNDSITPSPKQDSAKKNIAPQENSKDNKKQKEKKGTLKKETEHKQTKKEDVKKSEQGNNATGENQAEQKNTKGKPSKTNDLKP